MATAYLSRFRFFDLLSWASPTAANYKKIYQNVVFFSN